jgi:hypothetical protein
MRSIVVVCFVAVTSVACGGDGPTEPEIPVVSGTWSGSTAGITLPLTLGQGTDGTVTGSGNLSVPSFAIALTVSQGTHVYPNLTLVLTSTGYEDINLTGTVNEAGDQIIAKLNGSGFADDTIVLVRS